MWTCIISLQQHVSASEVLVPGAMMLVLSLIHSHIVSTHTGPTRDPAGGKSRQVKRTKRRLLFSSRSRTVYKLTYQINNWCHRGYLIITWKEERREDDHWRDGGTSLTNPGIITGQKVQSLMTTATTTPTSTATMSCKISKHSTLQLGWVNHFIILLQ